MWFSLQACEHDVLLAVLRWGEAQVIRNMNEQGWTSFFNLLNN